MIINPENGKLKPFDKEAQNTQNTQYWEFR
jgi:hypothetical protein